MPWRIRLRGEGNEVPDYFMLLQILGTYRNESASAERGMQQHSFFTNDKGDDNIIYVRKLGTVYIPNECVNSLYICTVNNSCIQNQSPDLCLYYFATMVTKTNVSHNRTIQKLQPRKWVSCIEHQLMLYVNNTFTYDSDRWQTVFYLGRLHRCTYLD